MVIRNCSKGEYQDQVQKMVPSINWVGFNFILVSLNLNLILSFIPIIALGFIPTLILILANFILILTQVPNLILNLILDLVLNLIPNLSLILIILSLILNPILNLNFDLLDSILNLILNLSLFLNLYLSLFLGLFQLLNSNLLALSFNFGHMCCFNHYWNYYNCSKCWGQYLHLKNRHSNHSKWFDYLHFIFNLSVRYAR